MGSVEGFEPAKFLTRVNGSEYLEVKWRLVWLRDRHPQSDSATELISHDPKEGRAVFKATVSTGGLEGSATGYGSETAGDFRDYLEKAETKAIGRALAALGFGTQFCDDHEFGAAVGRVVDAPVKRPTASSAALRPTQGPQNTYQRRDPVQQAQGGPAASDKQLGFIVRLARDAGWQDGEVDVWIQEEYGVRRNDLDKRTASQVIERLQAGEVGRPESPENAGMFPGMPEPIEPDEDGYVN